MANWKTTLKKVLSGQSDYSIDFKAFCSLLTHLGYEWNRTTGSHDIYEQTGWEPMCVQPKNGKAKHYQIKQLRKELRRHGD